MDLPLVLTIVCYVSVFNHSLVQIRVWRALYAYRNSEKCKHLSVLSFTTNLIIEIQINNRIIQKKGEIEEYYEGKQELITHKLGNLLPKLMMNKTVCTLLSHIKVPKALVLPSSKLSIKNTTCLHEFHSQALPSASYCHNFNTTNGKNL